MGDTYSFWNQLCKACAKEGKTPNKVTSELGISSSVMTNYKNGRMPTGDMLLKLSKHLNVSVAFLLTDIDIEEDYNIFEKFKDGFDTLSWLGQRFSSIRFGDAISDEQMMNIADFTGSTPGFIYCSPKSEYNPSQDHVIRVENLNMLDLIISIFDRVDNQQEIYTLQLQLTKIVQYWLDKAGITGKMLLENREDYHYIAEDKIRFLYNLEPEKKRRKMYECGFNLTDLDVLREKSGKSFIYMLTGKEYTDLKVV